MLNETQRCTIRATLKVAVDALLENKQAEWLSRCITPLNLSIEEMIKILKEKPELFLYITRASNFPENLINIWEILIKHIQYNEDIPAHIFTKFKDNANNYNPFYIAEMEQFEQAVQHLEDSKSYLVRLREAYLEMTLIQPFSYGEGYRTFYFRIGNVPFNLDQQGSMPVRGEIQADISAYVSERIELYEEAEQDKQLLQGQLEKEKEYRIAKEREEALLKSQQLQRQQQLLVLWEKSYSVLPIEFRQFLSSATQLDRHQIQLPAGNHPSTEDYWNTLDHASKKKLVNCFR